MIKLMKRFNVNYDQLLRDLSAIKLSIETNLAAKINKLLTEGYWAMGQRICKETIFQSGVSTQNGPLLKEPQSKELSMTKT